LVAGEVYELDIEIWPTSIVIPPGYRIALTIQGKDFERPGEAGGLGTMITPFRGSGPFVHTNPQDRPAEIFGGRVTIHAGGSCQAYLLLPIIPS
jgi:predicted acyl esterase